ncbi:MAG: T9SS type A sorting domain-containing protein [Bacteroidota bacterium]|nr:T9SS type A sorting domain-containing protein [Bacteroidota bacterium]
MKVIFIILIIGLSYQSYGQHTSFPKTKTIWSVDNEKFIMDGDSIFNSKLYKKFYYSFDSLRNIYFHCLFREDTVLKKAYVIGKNNSEEQLVYDFSLNLGDTARIEPLSNRYSNQMIIGIIDSIQILNRFHKRYGVIGLNNFPLLREYWIEGIGSTMGIFNSGAGGQTLWHESYPALLCVQYENGDIVNMLGPYCYRLRTDIEKIEHHSYVLEIYPNPFYQSVNVNSNQNIISYKIENSKGQLIKQENVGENKFQIDLSGNSNDIYFVTFFTSNGFEIRKLIKNGL